MLMTASSSCAPSATRPFASTTLTAVVWPPEGKPTGAPTRMSGAPASWVRRKLTQDGSTCTATKRCRFACSTSSRISRSPCCACTVLMSMSRASFSGVSNMASLSLSGLAARSAGQEARLGRCTVRTLYSYRLATMCSSARSAGRPRA